MNIITNISSSFSEIEVNINAPKNCEELENIVKNLNALDNKMVSIIGSYDNQFYIIDVKDILYFFTKDKKVFFKNNIQTLETKYHMYELEELLDSKKFIRISNSAIVNIKHIKCFDTSIINEVIVKFKDNTKLYVSKRKLSYIYKLLKGRKI